MRRKVLHDLYRNYLPSSIQDVLNAKGTEKFEEREKQANQDLDLIENFAAPGRLLDVGSAAGIFLNCAKRRGWRVEGTDLSSTCIQAAKKMFDIHLLEGELADIELLSGHYDVISLCHSIEHLRQPVLELGKLNQALKKNGILFISTPEHAKDIEILTKHHMLPYHLFNYTKMTLEKMLEKTGFKLVSYDSSKTPSEKQGEDINVMTVIAQKQ
jgi:2-polyprenyl-3-methyl-5-hydroxy-6-metoxy-1,4-benzoquinol methylase